MSSEEKTGKWNGIDRRTCARIAGEGQVKAAVIDEHGQPITRLSGADVVNVSGGGIAFLTSDTVSPGSLVEIDAGGASRFVIRTLATFENADGQQQVRGQLVRGNIPARLVYGWKKAA